MTTFIFIDSASLAVTMPASQMSHLEALNNDSQVDLFFLAIGPNGKQASCKVSLVTTAKKATDVCEYIINQVTASAGKNIVMKYDDVKGSYFTPDVLSISAIAITEEPTITGANGTNGQGVPTGGVAGQFLKKDSATDYDTSWSAKFKQVYSQSFLDDLSTTKHYLPFKDINEQTTIYQEEAAMVMPYAGRVVSCSVRVGSLTVSSGNITIGVHTIPTGSNHFSGAAWTEEETESLTYTVGDYYHTFHFVFDNAQHFEAGDMLSMSIQQSADLGSGTYYYVTTVVEYDFSAPLGTTSQEFETNP